jgi:hypothetical protein
VVWLSDEGARHFLGLELSDEDKESLGILRESR